jgi:hypothetical protein
VKAIGNPTKMMLIIAPSISSPSISWPVMMRV